MSTTSNPQTLVDLTQLAAAVRCRRRFWLSLGLVGLLLGAALAIVHPAPPTATAELLVTHADDPQDSGAILTDIAVLQSTPIAGAALRSLHESHLTPAQFLTTYQAVNVTDNVLKLTVDGATGTEAVARAKALSDAFIADHAARDRTTAHAQAQAYLDQQKQAKANLAQVDAAIAAAGGSSTGGTATSGNAALEALYAQRANLDSQITSLGNSATQARVGNPAVVAGTKIVDGPRQLPYSRLASLVEYAGVGLLVGLVIGLLLAAVGGVVRDRPTLRREISEHLGASVIAQFTERRRGLVKRLPRRSSAEEERERAAGTIAHL
ncbi:MAG: Wzz/FepE/Etk N-terminal domain-containing protein, partial [Sciscionella sp.]